MLTTFAKICILDIWQDFEYTSDKDQFQNGS